MLLLLACNELHEVGVGLRRGSAVQQGAPKLGEAREDVVVAGGLEQVGAQNAGPQSVSEFGGIDVVVQITIGDGQGDRGDELSTSPSEGKVPGVADLVEG